MVLHRFLALNGIESRINFGVQKKPDGTVAGHAWLEHQGRPLLEDGAGTYSVTFSLPSPRQQASCRRGSTAMNSGDRAENMVSVIKVLVLLTAFQGVVAPIDAAPRLAGLQNAVAEPAQGQYTVSVTNQGVTEITLNAAQARLSAIATDLKRLGKALFLGLSLVNEAIP